MVCAYASLNEVVTRVLSLFKSVAVAVIFHQKSKILINGIIFFLRCQVLCHSFHFTVNSILRSRHSNRREACEGGGLFCGFIIQLFVLPDCEHNLHADWLLSALSCYIAHISPAITHHMTEKN